MSEFPTGSPGEILLVEDNLLDLPRKDGHEVLEEIKVIRSTDTSHHLNEIERPGGHGTFTGTQFP